MVIHLTMFKLWPLKFLGIFRLISWLPLWRAIKCLSRHSIFRSSQGVPPSLDSEKERSRKVIGMKYAPRINALNFDTFITLTNIITHLAGQTYVWHGCKWNFAGPQIYLQPAKIKSQYFGVSLKFLVCNWKYCI